MHLWMDPEDQRKINNLILIPAKFIHLPDILEPMFKLKQLQLSSFLSCSFFSSAHYVELSIDSLVTYEKQNWYYRTFCDIM